MEPPMNADERGCAQGVVSRNRLRGRPCLCIAAFVCGFIITGAAAAATPAVLVDASLGSEKVSLVAVRDGRITYFDEGRVQRQADADGFVQLRAIGVPHDAPRTAAVAAAEGPDAGDHGLLVLTDGQRLPGKLAGASDAGDRVRWAHPRFGEAGVPLDRVRAVVLRAGGKVPAPAGGADIVLLANGDRLTGFVETMTTAGVSFVADGSEQAIELPLDRLAAVRLGNEPAPLAGRHRVWFADGTRLLAERFTLTGDAATLAGTVFAAADSPDAEPVTAAVEAVRRVDLGSPDRELIDLADVPFEVQGGEVFGLPMPPRVVDGELRLHAPVTVTLRLPKGAARLAMTAAFAPPEDAPASARAWAGMTLTVTQSGNALATHDISAASPEAAINVPIASGPPVVLELDDGVNGPILDRLALRGAVVLVEAR